MKNLPLLLLANAFAMIFLLNSCKKENVPIEQAPEIDLLESMPNSFTKKVLIEKFTSEYCGGCVDVYDHLKIVLDENPSTVFLTAIHVLDKFGTDQTVQLMDDFEAPGFPSTMVDRYTFSSQNNPLTSYQTTNIRNITNVRLGDKISTGLKIETEILDNGKANITIYVGRNKTITGIPKLTTYLQEDKIPSLGQVGAFNDPDYIQHHVLREVLTDLKGDGLNLSEKERDLDIFKYENIDIADFNKENLEVVAFVHYHDDSDVSEHEIINVQKVKLGKSQDWD